MLQNFKTYQLAKEFYQTTAAIKLPKHLRDQFHRASSSVVLNIAEGSGKRTKCDQARYYSIALGSLRESYAILDLSNNLSPKLNNLIDHLGGSLHKLIHFK